MSTVRLKGSHALSFFPSQYYNKLYGNEARKCIYKILLVRLID